jgi:hypothetical protein
VFSLAIALSLALASTAGASKTIDDFFGNPTPAAETVGGFFSQTPTAIAVNTTGAGGAGVGDIYVLDKDNLRIQRFDASHDFIAAWGKDVVSGGGTGYEICTVATSCKKAAITTSLGGELSASVSGLAIDQSTGNLYVADFSRIQVLSATGNFIRAFGRDVVQAGKPEDKPPVSAKQTLMVDASAGQFTLEFQGQKTADLAHDVPASGGAGPTASLQNALQALPAIGSAGVAVTGGPGGVGGTNPYVITFTGALKETPMPLIVAAGGTTPLSGGAASATVVNTTTGSTGLEVCITAANCKSGVNNGSAGSLAALNGNPAVAPPGAPNAGNLLVPDAGNRRVQEFTPGGAFVRTFGKDTVSFGPGESTGPNAQQEVTIRANGGTFTLGLSGQTATAIPFNAAPSVIEAKLNALSTIGGAGGFVTVTGGPGDETGSIPYVITFKGALENDDVPVLNANSTGLTGGSPSKAALVKTTVLGGAFEICTAASFAVCKGGAAGATDDVGSFSSGPLHLAADSGGAIYALQTASGGGRVQKLTPQIGPPALVPTVFAAGTLSGTSSQNVSQYIAVDPVTDHVFVSKRFLKGAGDPAAEFDESRVLELSSGGSLLDVHMANTSASAEGHVFAQGIALGDAGRVFVSFQGINDDFVAESPARIYVLDDVPTPTATFTGATDVAANTATLTGVVNPNGGTQPTSYRFEYSTDGENWMTAPPTDPDPRTPPPDVVIGNGTDDVTVTQPVTGLEADTLYQVRVVASKPFVPASAGPLGTFRTLASPPNVKATGAYWNGPTEMVLMGMINPNREPTTYYFEWGTDDSYGNRAPLQNSITAGQRGQPRTVRRQLFDLDTDTEYHFRLIATNSSGTSVSADQVAAPYEGSRVIELVSTGDSGGIDVKTVSAPMLASGGDRVGYLAQTIDDPISEPGITTYQVAERDPLTGWRTTSLAPDPARAASAKQLTAFVPGSIAADLSSALWLSGTQRDTLAERFELTSVGLDGSLSAASPLIEPLSRSTEPLLPLVFAKARYASADLSHLVYSPGKGATYVPGEPLISERSNLYDIDTVARTINLVNIDSAGGPIGGVCGAQLGGSLIGTDSAVSSWNPISSDGSAIYFTAQPDMPYTGECGVFALFEHPARLFKRVNGSTTIEVSKSQCTRPALPEPCAAVPGSDDFIGASGDGNRVFFTSPRQLANSDTDSAADLYLYDSEPPPGEPTLVQVSAGEETATHPIIGKNSDFQGVVNISSDGSRVYFAARGQLTPEATPGANNIYVFERSQSHPESRLGFVVTVGASDSGLWKVDLKAGRGQRFITSHAIPGNSVGGAGQQEHGDGRFLFFTGAGQLSPDDQDSVVDFYRYDDQASELTCISCAGDGNQPVKVAIGGAEEAGGYGIGSNVATDDGSTAVFVTKEGLVPEDENGTLHSGDDVYEWREGSIELISGAAGDVGVQSTFFPIPANIPNYKESPPIETMTSATLSPSGRDVFFYTAAKLVPSVSDLDFAADLYVARVGGGFPQPRPREEVCVDSEVCRGPTTEASDPPTVGSAGFSGSGNPVLPARCRKGKVRREGRCVKRRAKSGKRKSDKRKSAGRGANRQARGSK